MRKSLVKIALLWSGSDYAKIIITTFTVSKFSSTAATRRITTIAVDVCNPTPCGQNAVCINKQRAAACRCIDGFIGDPYTVCRRKPECVVHSDCPSVKSCRNERCVDPCIDTCGLRALCRVVNHLPICICQPGYEGDPFSACHKIELRKCMYLIDEKPAKICSQCWFFILIFSSNSSCTDNA